MKRKLIIVPLLAILLVISTFGVRAERRSGQAEPTGERQSGASSLVTRLVYSSFFIDFLSTRQEERALVLEGAMFFLLGLFRLKRAS